jgi:hypothetical protein
VPKVTLNVCVPAANAAFAGNVAAVSLEVMLTVSVIVLSRFQFASTALTVTLKAPPTFCPMGVPVFPEAVPGAAVSPGINNWSFVKAPGLTVTEGLVFATMPECVTSEAVSVAVPAVFERHSEALWSRSAEPRWPAK